VPFEIELDDRTVHTSALMVAVCNGPYGGLGFTFAPDARIDDGLLDVQVFRHFSKRELLAHFWSIAFGKRAYAPRVATYRSARVVVESRGLPWRADESTDGRTPATCLIRPGALTVIAP
jgi:diacylglycerol kinase (ATP)